MKLFAMFKKKTATNTEDAIKTIEDLQYILSLYESSYRRAVAADDKVNGELLEWKIQDTKRKIFQLQGARV